MSFFGDEVVSTWHGKARSDRNHEDNTSTNTHETPPLRLLLLNRVTLLTGAGQHDNGGSRKVVCKHAAVTGVFYTTSSYCDHRGGRGDQDLLGASLLQIVRLSYQTYFFSDDTVQRSSYKQGLQESPELTPIGEAIQVSNHRVIA